MPKKHTTTKFQNKYRIESARLQGYDYGSHGHYFVTICTKNRINYFGEISVFTEIGKIANNFWKEIPAHYPFVEIDHFIVMPNHIHGVLFFNRPDKKDWNPNQFGVQSVDLSPSRLRSMCS